MIVRIARLVPAVGHESTVIDHLRGIVDAAPGIDGLLHGTVARELRGDRQVVWVITTWASVEALAAWVGPGLDDLRLAPEIAALVEESELLHAEGLGDVTGA